MDAKDRTPPRRAPILLFGIAPFAFVLVLVLLTGCQPKAGDEATDSLNVSTEVPAPTPSTATRFVESSNGQEVVVAPGAEFEVALMSDPSTGLAWVWVDSTNSSIVLVERSTVLGEETDGSVSASGSTVWRFRAPTTGSAPIKLELRKPGDATATQTYVVTVRPE